MFLDPCWSHSPASILFIFCQEVPLSKPGLPKANGAYTLPISKASTFNISLSLPEWPPVLGDYCRSLRGQNFIAVTFETSICLFSKEKSVCPIGRCPQY